jgi:hypothetical protein
MTDELTCSRVRELAFERRMGELRGPSQALVDEHTAGCPTCAAYLANLDALLQAAAEGDGPLSSDAADALWDRLEAQLPRPTPGDRWRAIPGRLPQVLAAAAVLALTGLLLVFWLDSRTAPDYPAPPRLEHPGADRLAQQPAELSRSDPALAAADPIRAAIPRLDTQARPHDSVTVFAETGAAWSFHADDELRIELQSGTLLIEYLPEREQLLVVEAPGLQVEVLGTVFFVVADEGRSTVGTSAGRLRVTSDDGSTVTLEAGEQLEPGGAITLMGRERRALVAEHVDLDGHLRRLAARPSPEVETEPETAQHPRSAADSAEDEVRRESAPDAAAPGSALLRAENAQRRGRYDEAARILETFVEAGEPGQLDIGLARLELARLYETRLDRPNRAAHHLRRFLAEQPSDPAAASARRELCRLAPRLGLDEPGCTGARPSQ